MYSFIIVKKFMFIKKDLNCTQRFESAINFIAHYFSTEFSFILTQSTHRQIHNY